MLTGRQVREARSLLGLWPSKLAERIGVATVIIKHAESVDGECPVTIANAQKIQRYLESRGIEFLPEGSDPPVRSTKGEAGSSEQD